MGTTLAGVWRSELAGAFIYGIMILLFDLGFSWWRRDKARRVALPRMGSFLGLTFLARLLFILAGVGLAAALFDRTGRFVVCLTLLILIVPLGILAASRNGRRKG